MFSTTFTRPSIILIIWRNAVAVTMHTLVMVIAHSSMIILSISFCFCYDFRQWFLPFHLVLYYWTYINGFWGSSLRLDLDQRWIDIFLSLLMITRRNNLIGIFNLLIIYPISFIFNLLILMQLSMTMSEVILKIANIY